MNALETVRHIMLLNNVSFEDLAEQTGYKTSAGVRNRLNGKDIMFGTWQKLLDGLGFEVVVRKGDEEFVVSNDDTPSPLRFDMPLNFDKILGGKEND